MNNDLISRSELKKKIELFKSGHFVGTDYENGIIDGYDFCLDEIDNAPTVELTEEQAIDKLHETGWIIRHDKEMTERPQGKWISNNKTQPFCNPGRSCSLCGKIVEFSENFCPKCGADMRGDNHENND